MKSILLIEDNADILANLTEYLELEGYLILTANSEKKGIEMAREFIPDLIICDSPNPSSNGHEVLRLLIDTLETTDIPIIFSSTMSEANNLQDALERGVDDYIIKPFDLESILVMAKANIASGSKRQKCLQ
ncbi:MAG TPA: response regulator [Ferruginibacter sp.]|nr:response regulator [Chitinophagaceae bacterium]MBK7558894.1 response regulator [Chitinophagaceae bacterium]MBK9530901.1 response regulator [Chitinophagaceae bacterium]HQW93305.1 response regulator [Ferruginibacter sp.]